LSPGQYWKWQRRWRAFKRWLTKLARRIERYWPAFLLLVVWVLVLVFVKPYFGSMGNIEQGVYIEAWGTVFDLVFVALLLTMFEVRRDRRHHIERYQEEIDDFKHWHTDEARVRIGGNLRRLASLGITKFDLRGIVLRDFSFLQHRVNKLRGTTFATPSISGYANFTTELTNVDFSYTDCTDVEFSKGVLRSTLFGIHTTNLKFHAATLVNACFDGATMRWTRMVPDENDWSRYEGEVKIPVYEPPFAEADLTGATFRYALLENADFRYALNVDEADFTGARGLETCFFDEGVREKIVTAPPAER
jgi:uncharacterized protein YjbI with pentapeptide repeats